jgi:hypothetical protein
MAIGVTGRFSLVEDSNNKDSWVFSMHADGMENALEGAQVSADMMSPPMRMMLKGMTMRHGGSMVMAFCHQFGISPREVSPGESGL